jgi:hypothetical protein
MLIEYKRSGGFAGLRISATIDSAKLTAEVAATLEDLVKNSSFFDLPEMIIPSNISPDRFQYEITIKQSNKKHRVIVAEEAIPPTMRPLVDWLIAYSNR